MTIKDVAEEQYEVCEQSERVVLEYNFAQNLQFTFSVSITFIASLSWLIILTQESAI